MNRVARYAALGLFLVFAVAGARAGEISHDLFTAVLRDHVRDGKVNYHAIRGDKRFAHYISLLQRTDPATLGQRERLPFWINVYNAFTIKVIVDNYPVNSITDLNKGGMVVSHVLGTTVWDREIVDIGGKRYSLNDVEHKIIRPMGEPRIHFALVCAAKSCPPLRSEAYTASRLDSQLDEQARLFLRNRAFNRFDIRNNKVYLSKIFDWYGDDFGDSDTKLLLYLARFLPDDQAAALRARSGEIDIDYLDYDWSLNE